MTNDNQCPAPDRALHYHLMHPGGASEPGDPNAAFFIDGVCHLHYILCHPWQDGESFSFVHVSSTDMVHWRWHETKLQPAFTGHGMFSGTGFITLDGRPAVIYHGQGSGRNHIAIAADRELTAWEQPYAVEPKTAAGGEAEMRHWDPDCFRIGETWYAISGGARPPLIKSADLQNWTLVGDFLQHQPVDVLIGEDISCPNFFRLGDKWMLLCISHPFGCRYYLGDWDVDAEQFVPETHGRMNWRRPEEPIYVTQYRDFFAPESVLTPDGRRVMWAWLYSLDPQLGSLTLQSLPRELSLGADGDLRMQPLTELKSLRQEPVRFENIELQPPDKPDSAEALIDVTEIEWDAFELRLVLDREQASRKRFGLRLFAGDNTDGLDIMVRPESGTLHVGTTDAPFRVADLDDDEDVELRIFVDRYLVEVFANDRQAVVAYHLDCSAASGLQAYSYGGPTTIREITVWPLDAANEGFLEAQENRIWEPRTEL